MINMSERGNVSSVGSLDVEFSTETVLVISVISLLIFVFDLVGNIAVIHIVRTRPHMRTNVNLLIANLAAADLLMIVVVIYLGSFVFRQGFRWFDGALGDVLCSTFESLQAMSVFASVYTFLFIAIDRFCGVVLPLKNVFSSTKIKLALVVIWMTSVAFATPQFLAASVTKYGSKVYCFSNWMSSGISEAYYTIAFVTLTYIIPLAAIATLHTIAGMKLWRSAMPGHQMEVAQRRIRKMRRNASRMLMVVVVVFALCWLPLQVAEFLRALMPRISRRIPFWAQLLAPWFGIANSAINPFIYVMFCEKFHREFKRIFVCSSLTTRSDTLELKAFATARTTASHRLPPPRKEALLSHKSSKLFHFSGTKTENAPKEL